MEYTFTLKYQLADEDRDADALVERLGEAGCDDALVGIGQPGRLALEFTREAADADEAVRSALADVRCAAPTARFPARMRLRSLTAALTAHFPLLRRTARRMRWH